MTTSFMTDKEIPSFLPKKTLDTAPSQSFLFRFDPNSQKKSKDEKKVKAKINVYAKEISKESCEESDDPITDYDYVKFYVDFKKVFTLFLIL